MKRRYFAKGLRIPVEPNRVYTLQNSYDYAGVAAGSVILPLAVIDAEGRTVGQPDPMLPAASGTASGLASRIIETGPTAAYVEITPSQLGAGRVRAWGFQLEYGNAATAWSDEIPASGKLIVTLDSKNPELLEGTPLPGIFQARQLLDGGAIGEVPPGTDLTWRFRSRQRATDAWSAYHATVDTLPMARFYEVEVTVTTTSPATGLTPEIDEVYVSGIPPRPVLLMPDGSEFPGGVLVDGLSAMGYGDNTEASPRQDGQDRLREMYPAPLVLEDLALRCFNDMTATLVSYYSTHGERVFVIEGYGWRYLVQMYDVRLKPNRRAPVPGGDHPHTATGITVKVLSAVPLARGQRV